MKLLCVLLLLVVLQVCGVNSKVIQITKENYKGKVLKAAKTDMWLLEFYAPWCGFCKSFSPTFENMDNLLRIEQVKVGKIDCEPNKELCDSFEIVRFPSIKFIRDGLLYDYKFKQGTNEGMLAQFVREGFEGFEPVELPGLIYEHTAITDIGLENFTKVIGSHDWMLEFYSPQCAHSQKFTPSYQRLADKFAANVTAGRIDCLDSPDLCQLFEIGKYPTVFYLHDDQIWEFEGERSTQNLTKFFKGDFVKSPAKELPTSYGKYQPYFRILKFYFLGFEHFVIQHLWKAISFTFVYGLILGCCVLGKTTPQKTSKKIVPVQKQQSKNTKSAKKKKGDPKKEN